MNSSLPHVSLTGSLSVTATRHQTERFSVLKRELLWQIFGGRCTLVHTVLTPFARPVPSVEGC